jgi:hypothetical protein
MRRIVQLSVLVAMLLPVLVAGQTDDTVSLGDLARAARKNHGPTAQTVIDNDNLAQVMTEVEAKRMSGTFVFSFAPSDKDFRISSPDATCSLSFNANATALLVNPFTPIDIPQSELTKLDGPATIDGDTFQVSVHNGSLWSVREITVGLTIVRNTENSEAFNNSLLLPPPGENPLPEEKHSDQTVLLHLKGNAAPLATTVFRQKMATIPLPDQEWHWAVVEAKGIPPDPPANEPSTTIPGQPGVAGGQ